MATLQRENLQTNQTQLSDMERTLSGVLAQAPLAIAYLDGNDHRYDYVNELYVRAAGRSRAEDLV